MIDLIYVAYNSEKWIEKCFSSVMKSTFNLKEISIYVVDNNSTDDYLWNNFNCCIGEFGTLFCFSLSDDV